MALYEASSIKRSEQIEKFFKGLLTIKPTSVKFECVFLSKGLFDNKIRNRLNDDTLDGLIRMQNYHKRE